MQNELIILNDFCSHCNIEPDFVLMLGEDGLIDIEVRNNKTFEELNIKLTDFGQPRIFDLHSVDECNEYLNNTKEFLEGFVVVDKNRNRLKIKSKRYLNSSIPSKKEIVKKILNDEQFDDYPENFFDDEKTKTN